jgi:anti-anti-sigma regulatory factor
VTQMLSEVPTPRGSGGRPDAVPTRPVSTSPAPASPLRMPALPSPAGPMPPVTARPPVVGPPAVPGAPDDGIALETRRGRLLVRFSGEIDTALRGRFDQVLTVVRAAHEPVDVDCREVTFFGAEGVRMLVVLQRVAGGPGVAEFQPSACVLRALRLTGIERYPFG